jgi:Endonuclease/Exonuclease/phosphatase family.
VLLKALKGDFDCIIFSEAHLKNREENIDLCDLEIGDYKIYNTKNNKRKTDGVVVYIKKNLKHTVEEINTTDYNFLSLKIYKYNKEFIIHAIYRSPNSNLPIFLEEIKQILPSAIDNNKVKILTGDININIQNNNDNTQEYLNILAEKGYKSLVNCATRVTETTESCLDHIFAGPIKSINENFSSFMLYNSTTDHYPVILKISTDSYSKTKQNNFKHSNTQTNYENLARDIKQEKWENIYNNDDPVECIDLFNYTRGISVFSVKSYAIF